MPKMITNIAEIEALYREGKISRSTWWRGRKRGYITLDYHTKKDHGGDDMTPDDMLYLYALSMRVAKQRVIHYWDAKDWSMMKDVMNELAHDVFVEVAERRPPDRKKMKKLVYTLSRTLLKKSRRKWYSKYCFVPEIPGTYKHREVNSPGLLERITQPSLY